LDYAAFDRRADPPKRVIYDEDALEDIGMAQTFNYPFHSKVEYFITPPRSKSYIPDAKSTSFKKYHLQFRPGWDTLVFVVYLRPCDRHYGVAGFASD
jgi:hypothetical protein